MSKTMELTKTNNGQWKPGQSANLQGRPVGSRNQFSNAFMHDLAAAWAEHVRSATREAASASRVSVTRPVTANHPKGSAWVIAFTRWLGESNNHPDVRYWPKADIPIACANVRFRG
jgi:hypothetical protein